MSNSMKPKAPAVLDFRMAINHDIDMVLNARARVLGVDKAAVAREVLRDWAAKEIAFCSSLQHEADRAQERVAAVWRRRPIARRTQNMVFKRDGFKCKQCGDEPSIEKLHIDHIIPLSAGGSDELNNLQVLCEPCNLAKSNKVVAIK